MVPRRSLSYARGVLRDAKARLILDGGKGEDKIEVVFVTPQPQPDDDLDYRRVVH